MTTRICKIEKFIPLTGNPVFQIHEEVEINGRVVSLDPRNPTAAELQDANEAFSASQQSRIAELETERDAVQSELTELQSDYDSLVALRDELASQVESLQERIDELENPPNPFPDADWSGFRVAALSDPAVQRVAVGNPVLWPLLLMFLNELSSNPARAADIAGLWNMMESVVPVTAEEIDRVNAIAVDKQVPFRLDSNGQITGT